MRLRGILTVLAIMAMFAGTVSEAAGGAFLEENGLVVMEVESAPVLAGWESRTTIANYKGTAYYHCTADSFSVGGNSILNYEFTVATAGNYQVQVRSRIAEGTSNTDCNDCFIRLIDSAGNPVTPIPNANTVTVTWYKFYQNTLNAWTWQTSNKDNDPHALGWALSAGQTYTLQLSRRSKGHAVDRIVLWNKALYTYGANTGTSSSGATLDALPESDRATSGTNLIYKALIDFPTTNTGEVPYYADTARDALAIDAANTNYRGKFARAVTTFDGPSGLYDVTITTLTEEDGECTYRLLVNGVVAATYQNPRVAASGDSQPHTHTWTGISVNSGDTIAVESNTHSNGLIPESGGFAWARGRWRQIAFATGAAASRFSSTNDLFIAQFDGRPDGDDIHAQAAIGSMLLHPDFANIDVFGVHNAYGKQTGEIHDSRSLMAMIFGGPEGTNTWTDANTPTLSERINPASKWAISVNRIADKAQAVLNAGGAVWVMEAGQSDITSYWVAELITRGVFESVIKQKVTVVQHSQWNEDNASSGVLDYVKLKTSYVKVEDGNLKNSTPDYETDDDELTAHSVLRANAKTSANTNATTRALWTEADSIIGSWSASYSCIHLGGLDFSDAVEAWWIFEPANAFTIPDFWSKYVMPAATPPPPASTSAINCGGGAFTAADGTAYAADQYFTGGTVYTKADPISGTTDDTLYQSERYGTFTYNVPVSNGTYDVMLQFAEIYNTVNGTRIFDVLIEGAVAVDNIDIHAAVGHDAAHDVLVKGVTVSDGIMSIATSVSVDNPKLSAFRILAAGSMIMDEDGDGIDDDWETANFGNLTTVNGNTVTDFDEDGASDLHEYLADTDPKDPDSLFAVTEIKTGVLTDTWDLEWKGSNTKTYAIHTATNLTAGWTVHTNGISGAALNSVTLNSAAKSFFARILQE